MNGEQPENGARITSYCPVTENPTLQAIAGRWVAWSCQPGELLLASTRRPGIILQANVNRVDNLGRPPVVSGTKLRAERLSGFGSRLQTISPAFEAARVLNFGVFAPR